MLRCEIIKDLLPSYADNKCNEHTQGIIREHLCACEECKSYYKNFGADILLEVSVPEADKKSTEKKIKTHFTNRAMLISCLIAVIPLIFSVILSAKEKNVSLFMLGMVLVFNIVTVGVTMAVSYNTRFLFIPAAALFILAVLIVFPAVFNDLFYFVLWVIFPPAIGTAAGKIVKLLTR